MIRSAIEQIAVVASGITEGFPLQFLGVYRGREPKKLKGIRGKYTRGWIEFYRDGIGCKPRDDYWRSFREDLERIFYSLCAYCEHRVKGEIDHFKPKSVFPELVYVWSNWVFACHDCNSAKRNEWPALGYVDPCARFEPAFPERYFVFDTQVGFIHPNPSLSENLRAKSQQTIDDLGLNDYLHMKRRVERILLLSALLPDEPSELTRKSRQWIAYFASEQGEHCSVVRAWLSDKGFPY